jgi:glycosyltransferase involved in cell wall biosynthesis
MKKVLIIANLFHASPRIPGLAKYLTEFGWEPTILTVPIGNEFSNSLGFPAGFQEKIRIVETPYRGDIFWFWRKIFKLLGFRTDKSILTQTKEKIGITSQKSFIDFLFNLYRTIFAYPDEEKNWKSPALKVARELLAKERFDAIISSSSPVTSHIIANKLKQKYKIPWIADFRDLWTQNHNYLYPRWRKMFEERLEAKTLQIANALVTVSPIDTEKLKILHKKETVYTITNGFDPEKVNIPPVKLTPKFTITYTGQIYTGKQDPVKFLIALNNLISDKIIDPKDIEVRFYGREEIWLKKEIEKYNLSSIVKQFGQVSREIALKKQWESQLLLLLNWEDPEERGVYSGKVFEYLAARRPILVTGGHGNDVLEELIKETKAGVYCPKIEDIKKALKDFYLEFKQKGEVNYAGDWKKIEKYSYREMARKFAEILNQITKYEK